MPDQLRRLRVALYLVAFVFLATTTVDIVANSMPMNPSSATWRFGSVGAAANYFISIVFAASLAALVAAAGGHRVTLRVLGTLAALCGAVWLVAAIGFMLDVLQLRPQVQPEVADMYRIGAIKTLLKLCLDAAAMLALGIAQLRIASSIAGAKAARRAEGPGLVRPAGTARND